MAVYDVKKDGTGDYTTISDAVSAVRSSGDTTGNVIRVHEGLWNDAFTISGQNTSSQYYELRIVAIGAVIWSGLGVQPFAFRCVNWDVISKYLIIQGFIFKDFTSYNMLLGFSLSGFSESPAVELNNCRVYGNVAIERTQLIKFRDTTFINSTFQYTTNGNGSVITVGFIKGCTFTGCSDIRIMNTTSLGSDADGKRCDNNTFYNSDISVCSAYGASSRDNNIFFGCRAREYEFSDSTGTILPLPYTTFTDLAELNAITAPLVWAATQAYFRTFTLDDFGFPTTDKILEIKERAIGATRYASSAAASTPAHVSYNPTDFEVVGSVIRRITTGTKSFTFFVPVVPRALLGGRVFVHHTNTDYFADNVFSITVETSRDGVNWELAKPWRMGFQDQGGSVYDFDYLNEGTKMLAVIVTIVGPDNSLEFEGATLESRVLEDILPQDPRTLTLQKGTGPGYFLSAGYQVLIPEPVRKYFLVPAKSKYTFDELVTEQTNNPGVIGLTYADGANDNITFITITTGSGDKTIYTFTQL